MVLDYIIIGAGLSGLTAAKKINELKLGSVVILEKSRGVGGRMATRRTLGTRFDHGAQFYRLKKDIENLHEKWLLENVNSFWFDSIDGNHWCAKTGMTALAKSMTRNLEINLEKLITNIIYENGVWRVRSDKDEEWSARHLILSSPLPQSVKLLDGVVSQSSFKTKKYEEIKKIEYTKALIALVSFEEDIFINDSGYAEYKSGDFFSLADQKRKGISEIPALTITMSPQFSEEYFEHNDEVIIEEIIKRFSNQYPQLKILASELKKWRYCRPTSQYENLHCEIADNLYLIGDAFGGSSLLGAVRSAESLCQLLGERTS